MRLARRLEDIAPFRVMEVLARARALEAQGRSIIHLEIGEPDFPTAEGIQRAGVEALAAGRTQYTPALGLDELRAAIAASYPREFRPDPARVIVTPGASGALLLVLAALVDRGDRVLIAEPGYPCNRHFVRLFEGEPVGIAVGAATRYQLTTELIAEHWDARTAVALIGSPSNPTGTAVDDAEMGRIAEAVRRRGGTLIVDEIYHGLTYGRNLCSALAHGEGVVVINSFSKYYGMTGWRIGWLVAPTSLVPALERLAQNLYIAVGTVAQHAALAAFTPGVKAELERRRGVFQERRDYLVPALQKLGFGIPVTPDGAFYVYADAGRFTADSEAFALELLLQTGVAITPGIDFGGEDARRYVRFSYAATLENLQDAVERLRAFLL